MMWWLLPGVRVSCTKWGRMSFLLQGRGDSGGVKSPQTSELVGSPCLAVRVCCTSGSGHRAHHTWPSTGMRTRPTSRNQSPGSADTCSEMPVFWKSRHLPFEALVTVTHGLSLVAEIRASQGHSESWRSLEGWVSSNLK